MKTQTAICIAFDKAQARLASHGITVHTNDVFGLKSGSDIVCLTESVDGLTAFADALDFARAA